MKTIFKSVIIGSTALAMMVLSPAALMAVLRKLTVGTAVLAMGVMI